MLSFVVFLNVVMMLCGDIRRPRSESWLNGGKNSRGAAFGDKMDMVGLQQVRE